MTENGREKKLQERQIRKRESILNAAVKAFEEEGYERASMDRIAEIAGASKRTVYNYFESKEKLMQAAIEDLVAGQSDLKKIDYSTEKTLESQLAQFVDAELYMIQDPSRLSLIRILSSILVRNPGLCEKASQDSPSQTVNLIAWLKDAVADGRIVADDTELAAQIFYGLIQGLFNFPALFFTPQTEVEIQSIKTEAITVFLSRYQKKL